MSTRGCIARAVGDGWAGVINVDGSNPADLGVHLLDLFDALDGEGRAARLAADLIDAHPHGWQFAGDVCLCDAHPTITGVAPYHCTCPLETTACQPLHIEWAYVIAESGLFVYRSIDVTGLDDAAYAHAMAAGELGPTGGRRHELAGHVSWSDYDTMRQLDDTQ